MNNLVKTFENHSIQIVMNEENEPLFVVKDICDALELGNTTEAVRGLDDDEYLTSEILRSGQRRSMKLVDESGLYTLLFRSTKPNAKKFRKWVTKEVLPSIRKTGSYEASPMMAQKRTIHLSVDMVLACVEINDKTDRLKMAAALLGIDVNPALQRFAIEDTFKKITDKFSTAKEK